MSAHLDSDRTPIIIRLFVTLTGLRSYPTLKEIFVCSNDGILNHLCNELQNQGLIVYWVRRQGQNLHIDNRNTGKSTHYSLPMATKVTSFEKVIDSLQDLIKTEEESINAKLNTLVDVATLFQERCEINIKHNLNQPEKDKSIAVVDNSFTESIKDQENLTEISNGKILDKLLLKIIQDIQNKSPKNKLSVSTLGTEIRKITGESPNSIIEKLNLGSSFLKYLKSSPTFTLKPNGKEYEVTALFCE
ncbi:hypothetical protein [Nostoc sp. FACHB-888]|uniref:hypothetical protein n=1 Tax=Nostoc sp. FACHB-888 TaxID=2692842 RepID=UPI0019A64898|nr:hypothetical protein [Nostoc sp. FACHB-888]MBD2246114.1 hypothetical protein [Nostoc sp. FACHB-888]